jgi:hypothetical protein
MSMINLAVIAKQFQQQLIDEYGQQMGSIHYRALNAIINCHTPQAGALLYHCEHCHGDTTLFPSCGHRHCPACQHKANNDWLDMQRSKLLPVDYYLVTFTLPAQLRPFAYAHKKWAYQSLFIAAKQTLDAFFAHDKQLGENSGYLAVLHTHSRRLEFHPHVHFVVPAGGLNKAKSHWLSKTGKYLFKADNLAKVFRGKFVTLMAETGYYLPANTPKSWVADCEHVGSGDAALTYLARYLYRSVISEQNILRINNGKITFQYKESKSKQFKTITEPANAFLWRILQHVLPKGFRRARNYGFLHGNAKATLQRLQLILKVRLPFSAVKQKKTVCCPKCQHEMQLYIMRIGTRLINIGSPI